MKRDIITDPDARLHKVCAEVGDEDISGLIEDLTDTLKLSGGLGLSAPQIGVLKRVFVMNDAIQGVLIFINPKIYRKSWKTERRVEGCLSLPGIEVSVKRAYRIAVEHTDGNWETSGLPARVIQHEVDHLDGILITDRKEQA